MFLDITNNGYQTAGYSRKQFEGYNLYKQFHYQALCIDVSNESRLIRDVFAKQLWTEGYIETKAYKAYIEALDTAIGDMAAYREDSNESFYSKLLALRSKYIDEATCKSFYEAHRYDKNEDNLLTLINQERCLERLCREKKALIFYITEWQFVKQMIEDIKRYPDKKRYIVIKTTGRSVYRELLIEALEIAGISEHEVGWLYEHSANYAVDLTAIEGDAVLQNDVAQDDCVLIGYGEEMLFAMRELKREAIVRVIPNTLYGKALTNVFSQKALCTIYVPKNFNIYQYVTITGRTRIAYYHLYRLWQLYGESIYTQTIDTLETCYPEMFINIYEDFETTPMLFQAEEVRNQSKKDVHILDQKDALVKQGFEAQEGIRYVSGYFKADTFEALPVAWDTTVKQDAILVNGVLIEKAHKAGVMEVDEALTTRQYLREKVTSDRLKITSNFLFFSTSKTLELHNVLRSDKPYEQLQTTTGHIDYKMYYDVEGKRKEGFPLYNKPCIAMCEDNTFRMFPFALEGGMLQIGTYTARWEKKDINREMLQAPIKIYTPYLSKEDMTPTFGMKERMHYQRYVGEGRLNIVIIGTTIHCIKQGALLLPCNGVVVSLDAEEAGKFLKMTEVTPLDETYYDSTKLLLTVTLDCPYNVKKEDWEQFKWVYGGAISLIVDGQDAFDEKTIYTFMQEEGWATPLSMQTQESDVHTLSTHPRTAIGINTKGQLFILIYSGRTPVTKGANYIEMIQMARKLIPDIAYMINADGGGSSVLGMLKDKSFMELSYPASSDTTCTGMSRNVKTMFYVEV